MSLPEAVERHPELFDYGRYAMQIEPFLAAYGLDNVLPVFFPAVDHRRRSASSNASADFWPPQVRSGGTTR